MNKPSMHLKKFAFSVELIQEMITTGWEVGTDAIVRCTHGLPANAKFEWCEFSAGNAILLVFSHPTWPAVADPHDMPWDVIKMRRIERQDGGTPK